MNLDDLQAALSRANEARETAERRIEGASPEQRAALEMEVRLATGRAEEARRNLREAEERQHLAEQVPAPEDCGFGGKDLTPEEAHGFAPPEEKRPQLKDPEAVQERETVRTYVVNQGSRIGPLARSDRIIEVHTHPDIVEARQANARQAAISERVAQEREQRQAEQKAKAEAERKDMDRAARQYEGLPQNRGLTRADYIRMEKEWGQHLDANPEKRQGLAEQQRAEYIEKRSTVNGVPYREPAPGEAIQGKVVGVKSFEGVKHVVIETTNPPPERIVMQGELKGAALGREVAVRTDDAGRLAEVREREDQARQRQAERGR